MDWHDKTCRRLDKANMGELVTCLSCGSFATKFDYPPIKQRNELRLLRLQHAEFDQPVQCQIFTEAVDRADFEAISYTWADESGDNSKCCSIFLNSRPFPVTRNCEMALKRVRARRLKRYIWIDAVCIDQTNDAERGHQVRLMPDIYSRAKTVLVYIGEGNHDSAAALELVAEGNPGNITDIPKLRQSLADLWSRRYFSRAWVLQEVALARRACLICGDTVVPWRCLQLPWLTCLGILGTPGSPDAPAALHFGHNAFTRPDRLLDLLDFASDCQAEDPRDKVYSLLGLMPGGRVQGIDVDYSLSVKQVYTNTALFLGRQFGWHRVLSHALCRQSKLADLPSWAPDWSAVRSSRPDTSTDSNGPYSLQALGADAKTLTFQCLRSSSTLATPAAPAPIRPIRLMALEKLTELWRHHPFLCVPKPSSLFDTLLQSIGAWKWTPLRTYSAIGKLTSPPESPSSTAPSRYQLTQWQNLQPQQWACLRPHKAAPYVHCSVDLYGLGEIVRCSFEVAGPDLVIPLDTEAWRPIHDRLDSVVDYDPDDLHNTMAYRVRFAHSADNTTATRVKKVTKCIRDLAENSKLQSRKEATKMAEELLAANFLMELEEVCIV